MDTRHPDEGTLYAYVEGQLPADEHSRVDGHVAACAECATLVAEARGLIAAASGIIGALDDVPANVIPRRPVRRLPPWLAAAAVVVLAVGISTVAVRTGTDSGEELVATASEATVDARQQVDLEQSASVGAASASIDPEPMAGRRAVERRSAVADAEVSSPWVAAAPENATARKSDSAGERLAFSVAREPVPAPTAPVRVEADAASAAVGAETGTRVAVTPTGRIAAPAPGAPSAAAATSVQQGEAKITGRVMTEDGRPIPGANVFINSLNVSVATDANGRYALVVPSGEVQGQTALVRARAIGYSPQSNQVALAGGSQTADFELRRELTEMTEVTVTGGATSELREAPIPDAASPEADSISARNARARALQHQVAMRAPMRSTRYEVSRGMIVELREFHALVRLPPAEPGMNEFRWSDSAGTRRYVLSGPLTVAELERLASRLGELRVVR
ncbi:MAG TPA: carboxypeptidase-like regulatory domain-containing protein [Gemmatimonadaceae bacterium]|nr:carboxypeptidase-like regulatory domain-containing protein [Gemmatimonadaceae bacterium]